MIVARDKTVYDFVHGAGLNSEGGPGGWCIVAESNRLWPDLKLELEIQLGLQCEVLQADSMDWSGVSEFLSSQPNTVVVIRGIEGWDERRISDLDLNRSSLQHLGFVILQMDRTVAGRFLNLAPNLRSWIGGKVFGLRPDPGIMTDDEREQRLAELAEDFEMTSEEVLRRSMEGSSPPDPEFAEWLALLESSHRAK